MDIQSTPTESAGGERHLDGSIPPEAGAAAEYARAAERTSSLPEHRYLTRRAAGLNARGRGGRT